MATAFLIYLQILLVLEKKRSRTKDRTAKAVETLPQPIKGSKATIFPDDEMNIPSAAAAAAAANTNNNHLLDPTDGPSDDRLRLPHFAIRFRNRMMDTRQTMSDDVSLASGYSTPVGGGGGGDDGDGTSMFARGKQSVDFDRQISDDDFSTSQSVAWMDVSKFGSIFNHEGSSLFLKVGALCKLPFFTF